MKDLQTQYQELLDSQQFDESLLDYSLLDQHIDHLSHLSVQTKSMITVFDHFRQQHAYVSENHREVFGFERRDEERGEPTDLDVQIHPDDFQAVMRNGVACMKYFFVGNKHAVHHKLIREYRINIKGAYVRVTEQIQVLEIDPQGNIWLAFCMMDISPDQSSPFIVNSKLIDCRTGYIITPVDTIYDGKPLLSEREVEILKLVDGGYLSKEIAEMLSISVHTVNTHRQRILEKLHVGTSIEAIRFAAAAGLLGD